MKTLVICTLLLACAFTTNPAKAEDGQTNLLEKYIRYLAKYMDECAVENNIPADQMRSIAPRGEGMACARACVMKKMKAMDGNKIQLDVVNGMIEEVHAGNGPEIEQVKKVAADCAPIAEAEGEECKIAMKFADCYIGKMMGAA